MLTHNQLRDAIPHVLEAVDVPDIGEKLPGKVRDNYVQGDRRILITTDRISAFDRILGLIPYKGQVLNQLSAWWFEQTRDIVRNHLISVPDPNVMIAHNAETIPVEVVVRGYITGVTDTSLWTLYERGERKPYGIPLPEGLKKNDHLPQPVITPTTKATQGRHDERLSRESLLQRELVPEPLWEQIETTAIKLFEYGSRIADETGLILVDTKYEFGLIDGELALIDEVHTPDSSRYWTKSSYENGNPQNFSKEFLREWFKHAGYTGEGEPPKMPEDFVALVAQRYIGAYEKLTGKPFEPGEIPAQQRILKALAILS